MATGELTNAAIGNEILRRFREGENERDYLKDEVAFRDELLNELLKQRDLDDEARLRWIYEKSGGRAKAEAALLAERKAAA